jgi:hypothetical protein
MEERLYASSLITHTFSYIKKYFLTVNKKDVDSLASMRVMPAISSGLPALPRGIDDIIAYFYMRV